MTACPTCAADNPEAARFCNQCGARLEGATSAPARPSYTPRHLAERILKERSALRGEKKRVTVLFCDIKGSTRLAQQAGAEAWHHILDRFFGLLGSAIHRYEGTINQYTGDGIMALFGAPLALEDHAQRACFAALEMQRELRRFADELRLSQGLNLTLRVGLNSGEVIVGTIGDDLRMDYTAQGHTVNLAARMEHICEPGRVYLSRETARLVEGYFALRSLGRMQVDGIDEAVEVFDLEGIGPISTRLDRSLARGSSPFIGREAETATLLAALDKVRGGEGQVVAVVGEAGIGKSRLCHEFLQACREGGFEVHRATGVPYAAALPLHPVRALALSRLGLEGRSNPAEIRRLVAGTLLLEHPEHAAALPAIFDFLGAGEASDAAPDQTTLTRAKLFELLAHFLPCPREQPLALLIEDLHFLDAASEELLQALAQSVRGHRALLLLNHRPEYPDAWLAPVLDARIAVTALDAPQLSQLARTRLGGDASVASLAAEIGARAGGNPFFVEEAVQALADAGHLQGTPGHYQLASAIDQWPIPDTVHALLAARIDRLPADDKALLQSAAVMGEAFTPALLATLVERAPEVCAAALRRLDAAGFLCSAPSGVEYDFRHPLMREVTDGLQLESQRARSHARMAQLLAAQHPIGTTGSAAPVRIAHHWQQAGEWARAGEWNLHAARWASTRDMGITITQAQLALVHLDRAPDSAPVQQLRIAARAGLIRMAQFTPVPPADVERAYAEGRAMAIGAGDMAGVAELTISYGNEALHRSDALGAVRLHTEAVRLCLANRQAAMVQRFRLAILISHFSAGLPREGIALVDEADEGLWRREPIGEENFVSRAFHALMLAWLGDLPRAREHLALALDYAQREGRNTSWMHAFMVDLAWFDHDGRDVLHHGRRAVELAQQSGSAYFQAIAGRAQALALCLSHRAAEAIPLLENLTPLCAPGGLAHQFEANHLAALAQAYESAGQYEAALRTAEAAIASAQRSASQVWEINAWLVLLALPDDTLDATRAQAGIARLGQLITASGAAGYTPWLARAQSRWMQTARVLDRA
ncbi:MAG: adenylate/guanylate cyclase domain-containing protein [Stagnimonas sp.]|nr:adenylate/guanylate cyclase domain-containing protein [Stagnimonas sp.]